MNYFLNETMVKIWSVPNHHKFIKSPIEKLSDFFSLLFSSFSDKGLIFRFTSLTVNLLSLVTILQDETPLNVSFIETQSITT